jgi:minor extracellular serine protease Vpr
VSLSFGTYRINTTQSFKKKVFVRNYSNTAQTYQIANSYRDAPNLSGVTITAPPSIFVPANGAASFTLSATVNPTSLPFWTLDGGPNGSNGELLNRAEFAGLLNFTNGPESIRLPWHILPHRAANVIPATSVALNGNPQFVTLSNATGAVGGLVDVFSLTGVGTQFPPVCSPSAGGRFYCNQSPGGRRSSRVFG